MDDDSRGMRTGKRKERIQEVEEGYILGRKCRELPKNMPTSFRLAEVALFCASSTPMYYLLYFQRIQRSFVDITTHLLQEFRALPYISRNSGVSLEEASLAASLAFARYCM